YNASAKARGFSEFKSKWGKRQNVDNWRRISTGQGINNAIDNKNLKNKRIANINKIPQGIDSSGDVDAVKPTKDTTNDTTPVTATDAVTDISYDGLLANVPTTDEKLKASHTLLSNTLFELAILYQTRLEDYESAIKTYERSLKLYPDSLYGGELYMNLLYCYQKLGNPAKANEYKNLLTSKFAESKFSKVMQNPKAALDVSKNTEATKRYEAVYNLFIEGEFDKALEEKKAADSLYGNNYWTPQLLYIESVYYIKQKEDSLAIDVLNNIIASYPNSPLKEKAATMIDVLQRRSEIENYLTNLQIERAKENEPVVINETPVTPQTDTVNNYTTQQDSIVNNVTKQDSVIVDSVKEVKPPVLNTSFNFEPGSPQFVAMLLDKVDPVYISEARNAFIRYNREKFSREPIEIAKEVIDKDKSLLVFRQFTDAAAAATYADKIKKDAAVEISWLPANKYSFFIISDANLQLLKLNKDVENYLKVLRNALPGSF
ncbi:MAG: tetratricopeptide repeat protein, partial [Ginsengibacter sp.]